MQQKLVSRKRLNLKITRNPLAVITPVLLNVSKGGDFIAIFIFSSQSWANYNEIE